MTVVRGERRTGKGKEGWRQPETPMLLVIQNVKNTLLREKHRPGCLRTAERDSERHLLLGMLLAHTSQQDRMSIRHQIL
jgi:hypothetical protein